eukprot:GGOE01056647.1.p1 GENE.GGOE01056647.1~~GGOE01056647.1.p1  ORF type:complete len:530 (+),score=118.79 GGOE01056647.1:54-1643(+)
MSTAVAWLLSLLALGMCVHAAHGAGITEHQVAAAAPMQQKPLLWRPARPVVSWHGSSHRLQGLPGVRPDAIFPPAGLQLLSVPEQPHRVSNAPRWATGVLLALLASLGFTIWQQRVAAFTTAGACEDLDPTWEAEVAEDIPDEEDLVPFGPTDPVFAPEGVRDYTASVPALLSQLRAVSDAAKAGALRGLQAVAASAQGRQLLLQSDCIPYLLAAVQWGSGVLQEDAMLTIARLALNRDSHRRLRTAGALKVLLEVAADSNDAAVQVPTLAALACLADTEPLKGELVRLGIVDLLLGQLQATTGDVQERALRVLSALARTTACDVQRSLQAAISQLVSMLSADEETVQCGAAEALALLCFQNADLQAKVCEAKPAGALVSMLRVGSGTAKCSAAEALAALAPEDMAGDIAATGGNQALLEFVRSTSGMEQLTALRALAFVALLPANAEVIAKEDGIETLTALLRGGSEEVRAASTLVLAHIAAREIHIPRIAASGVPPDLLLPLCDSDDELVCSAAAFLLHELHEHASC